MCGPATLTHTLDQIRMDQRTRSTQRPVPPAPDLPGARRDGEMRLGPVLPLLEELRALGADPAPLLAQADIHARLFDDAENSITLTDLGRLLGICVAATGCVHLGLLIGQRFKRSTLGALGELMEHCASVDDALRSLVLYLHLNDRAGVPLLLHLSPTRVAFGYSVYHGDIVAAAQVHDGAIAIAQGILRRLCGPAFRPIEVSFAHRAPADIGPYRRFFGVPLRFDAELTAVSFAPSWLARHIEGADPSRHARLEQAMRAAAALSAETTGLAELVHRALHALIIAGTDAAPQLARLFGLHERALRRRLLAEGTSVQALARKTRFDLAAQLLRDTRLPLAEVAAAMHYADATAFTRAFRGWAGTTPGAWRAMQRAPLDPSGPEGSDGRPR